MMLRARWGTVTAILAVRAGAMEVQVEIPAAPAESGRALAYPALTGPVAVGDRVLVNTTAVHLNLGTGGLHFIMAVDKPPVVPPPERGHQIKLRYTPLQHAMTTVEEGDCAARLDASPGLQGMPVIAAELHSQVAAIAAGVLAAAPTARIAYVMPDTAALPLALSRLIPRLRDAGLIHATLTCGQAFGGDLETVSLPSALLAAKEAASADVVIVAQGPGNAGTGTRLGFSGIAQAEWLHAAHSLGGTAIAALRLSFADPRPRHQGVSHHSLTILQQFTLCRVVVAAPLLPPEQDQLIGSQLAPLQEKHQVERHDGAPALALLENAGVSVTTMGRSLAQERAFFMAAGAAGAAAASRLGAA